MSRKNVMSGTTVFGKEICVPEDQIGQAKELIKDYESNSYYSSMCRSRASCRVKEQIWAVLKNSMMV